MSRTLAEHDDQKLRTWFIFYVAAILFLAVGATTTDQLAWYGTLAIPSWAPSDLLVALIWFALFCSTAVSLNVFWNDSAKHPSFRTTVAFYASNALLILLWNYLFFGLHLIALALVAAVAIGVSVGVLIVRTWRVSRGAAWFLTPYLAWLIFAIYLNYSLMLMNH